MNIPRLKHLLETATHLPPLDEHSPEATLRSVEAQAEAQPFDPRWSRLIRALHGWTTAGQGIASDLGGVHRTQIVRWDTWTTTWEGRDVSGKPVRIRILRPHAAADPVLRRTLHREAKALEPLVEGLTVGETWIRCPSPGEPLPEGTQATGPRLARLVTTGTAALQRWESCGVWPAEPSGFCWRDHAGDLVLICLTAERFIDAGPTLSWLAERLAVPDPDSALERLVRAIVSAPPRQTSDLNSQIAVALAADLTQIRHELAVRQRKVRVGNRLERLLNLVQRLGSAAPLPKGTGATGVDLEGRITILRADEDGMTWGTADERQAVWTLAEGMDAPLGRRVLRARAAAPPNARLDEQIDGDPEFTRHATRWLAARMRARTLRLLLKRQLEHD